MQMPVVNVRVMRMCVRQRRMLVRMRMRRGPIPRKIVRMPMVRVVPVRVAVFKHFVRVRVCMPLAQVQPDAQSHQHGCRPKQPAWHVGPQDQRTHHTEQGRH